MPFPLLDDAQIGVFNLVDDEYRKWNSFLDDLIVDPLADIDLTDMKYLMDEPELGPGDGDDLLDIPDADTIVPPINFVPRKGDASSEEEKFTLRATPKATIAIGDPPPPTSATTRPKTMKPGPSSRSSTPTGGRSSPDPQRSPSRTGTGGIYKTERVRVVINGYQSETVEIVQLKNVWSKLIEAAEKDFRDQLEPSLNTILPHVISTKQLNPTEKRMRMDRIKEIRQNLNTKVGKLKTAAAAAVHQLDTNVYRNSEDYLVDVHKKMAEVAWNAEGTDILKQINDVRNT